MGVCQGCGGVCSRRCRVVVSGHSRADEGLGIRAIFILGRLTECTCALGLDEIFPLKLATEFGKPKASCN